MSKQVELPRFYWGDNIYRAKRFNRVMHCYECDCTPRICAALGRPCLALDPHFIVLKLVK